MKELEAFSCNIHLRVGHQSIGKAVSILFVVLDTRNGSIRNKLQLGIALHMSALCLHNVTSYDLNFQAYPLNTVLPTSFRSLISTLIMEPFELLKLVLIKVISEFVASKYPMGL